MTGIIIAITVGVLLVVGLVALGISRYRARPTSLDERGDLAGGVETDVQVRATAMPGPAAQHLRP